MLYNYQFFRSLFQPNLLMAADEYTEIRGYKRRVFILLFITLAYFGIENFWGMPTSSLTSLFVENNMTTYVIARLFSLIGSLLMGLSIFIFHYYLISYLMYLLTDIPFIVIKKVQLFVVAAYIIEKFILLIIFYSIGYSTNLSFLSFAPIFNYFTVNELFLFFINQFTVFSIIAGYIQFIFLSKYEEVSSKATLLIKIIFLHIFFAAIIAGLSISPYLEWIIRGLRL